MKIDRVEVTYGELRSTGYPSFSNCRRELTLGAKLEIGESAKDVEKRLFVLARNEIRSMFGENVEQTELDIPF